MATATTDQPKTRDYAAIDLDITRTRATLYQLLSDGRPEAHYVACHLRSLADEMVAAAQLVLEAPTERMRR